MANFLVRFLISNIIISIIIGILLPVKRLFKSSLTSRMQYDLWFLLFGLLAVPFIPVQPMSFLRKLSWINLYHKASAYPADTVNKEVPAALPENAFNWMNDFSVSIAGDDTFTFSIVLLCIWLFGILAMLLFMGKSYFRLRRLEGSALPLHNRDVYELFSKCIKELNIRKEISIYCCDYIKSPFTVGLLKPRIYLPSPLILDFNRTECRYMLLHELQHYKHGDALVNGLVNLVHIVYWFNPAVLFALKEIRNDREVACDSSVLKLLNSEEYEAYGNTLINFAQRISLSDFPFASNIGGNMKQLKKRIINIATYHPVTQSGKIIGICSCFLIAFLFIGFTPLLSVGAAAENTYHIKENGGNISYIDLSSYFDPYQGCFVLYDSAAQGGQIYNLAMAQTRISPNSTYKIYSALLGLEKGFITPGSNDMIWNGQEYPIAQWNKDQNLTTAFQNSVNWYFQTLDLNVGIEALEDYYTSIKYGNHDLSGGLSYYWAESSLKISPIEQVEMLQKLYMNEFHFDKSNIQTVKNALLLSSSPSGKLYGKTGTGNRNGQNINGWFIGYVETPDTTYFFATNIQHNSSASGSTASEITLRLLDDLNIFTMDQ